jgi:hypothetical protein
MIGKMCCHVDDRKKSYRFRELVKFYEQQGEGRVGSVVCITSTARKVDSPAVFSHSNDCSKFFLDSTIVTFLFVFDNYCPTMD